MTDKNMHHEHNNHVFNLSPKTVQEMVFSNLIHFYY